MVGQIRLRIRYQNLKTPWFDYLIVSQNEMKEMIQGTGWVIRQFINSEGPQYIAVIKKSGNFSATLGKWCSNEW
jgi:hypothetical protein